jgi:glycerol-3-phosphate dehydrogenase
MATGISSQAVASNALSEEFAELTANAVLILGVGINGAAIARELALSGVSTVIVDTHDIASGATAYSSRLIHGGLRYLEYGEFDLVRESLEERTRWLRLAPQFVRPLRLFIPIRSRRGGLISSAGRFLGLKSRRRAGGSKAGQRGLWSIRVGLWLYDTFAHDRTLPRRRLYNARAPEVVKVDSTKYRWMYSFSDAQIVYPERFTLALLEDARALAAANGCDFRLFTYHRAERTGKTVRIAPTACHSPAECSRHAPRDESKRGAPTPGSTYEFEPAAIVNATGAWVDHTLAALHVPSPQLMGGTKGSHFITHHATLRERLAGRAIYVEATDGRPVFVLPFRDATLVGTTDVPFEGDPANAVASPEELEYLVAAVNDLFPDLHLTLADITLHYSGVRPLPATGPKAPAAITRRHWLEENHDSDVPLYSVIGGKLTTCRSLAESAAATILKRLGREPTANSRTRSLPGAENYPTDEPALAAQWEKLAAEFNLPHASIQAIWSLVGTRTESILAETKDAPDASALLTGTAIPRRLARWMIDNEWATTLEDLVERRLMLLYNPELSRACLVELAMLLAEAGHIAPDQVNAAVQSKIDRLSNHFGKKSLGFAFGAQ